MDKRAGVRARKSPWIETDTLEIKDYVFYVMARKSPWIETRIIQMILFTYRQGS